ncbi:MAG: TraB/GumN family protein [Flavobacteriales bacterium]
MTHSIRLKSALLLGTLFMLIQTFAQNNYQSHMWEITGNGLSRPSYLFGTMHVSNKVAFHLGDPFYDAIESCDYVALELEPDIWMHEMFKGDYFSNLMNKTFRFMGNGRGRGYSGNFLFEVDHEKLITTFLKTDDGFTNFMLTRSVRGNEEFEEDSWLDMHIYQCAKKLKKKSFGLETFESSMANAERAAKEQYKDKDYYSKSEERMEMQTKMEAAYRRGDLDFVYYLSRLSYPGESYKYMLTDRNEDFVHTMDSLMKQGALFAAMGCAHLPGKDGVIEMLRANGYTVTPKSKGVRDAKRKAEVEKKLIERPLQHFTSEEGYISFDAPSEVYSMTVDGMGIVYLSLDMPNGGNYMLQRSEWWPTLFKMNRTEMADAIESLLYEKIKGEIVSQKRSIWNGYPSFDILSKSLKGDYSKMKIIITDNELIKLTVQAPRDIVKKGYGKFFFDTFSLKESASISDTKELFDGKLKVNVPGVYHSFKGDVEMKMGGIIPSIITNKNDITILAQGHLSDPEFIDEDDYELQEFGRYFFNQTGYSDSTSAIVTWKNQKAIRASFAGMNDRKTEALLVGNGFDYYAIQVLTDNPATAEGIFNSVEFTESVWPTEYYPLTDSTLMFCAEVPWKPEEKDEEDTSNGLYGMFGSMGDEDEKEKKDIGREKSNQKVITDPVGKYSIEVSYHRNSKYTAIDPENNWYSKSKASREYNYFQMENDRFNPGSDYAIRDSSFVITANGFDAEYIYTDTLCKRAHRLRFVLDDMNAYIISYVNDSDKIHNPFVDHFMETFTPLKDSVTGGLSLFQDKFDMVYAGLQSADTLEFEFALDYQYSIYPQNETEYEKVKKLDNVISPVVSKEDREYLKDYWKYFQYLDKSDTIVEELAKEYTMYSDSADYQVQILENLINMETKKSRLKVKELLLKEPPIIDDPDFIDLLSDSVERIVKILPSLLELTEYEEYKWDLYEVLESALDSGIVKPADYAFKIPDLLREAKLELKRTAAITETENNGYDAPLDQSGYYPPLPPGEYYYPTFINSNLSLFIHLLEPHKKNPEVSTFLQQIEEHKKPAVIKEYIQHLQNEKRTIPDAMIQKLIKEDEKIESIEMLTDMERTDLIPKTWDVLDEYLREQIKHPNTYSDAESKVDSIQIDSTFEDQIKSRKFKVHFVRYKKDDALEWTKAVVAYRIDNLDKTRLLPNQWYSSEIGTEEFGGSYNPFGYTSKSANKKDLTDEEKLVQEWLDMKAQQRNPNSYAYDYYDY